MRHREKRSLNNRFTSWREATLVSLAKNMLVYQSIKTTRQKAKASRGLVEGLISLAKVNTLMARREAAKILNDHRLVSRLFNEIGPRFAKRQSGFTRIINLGIRRGDDAQMVIFELTEIKKKEQKKPKKEKEDKPEVEIKSEGKEKGLEDKKADTTIAVVKEKPPITQKPAKKFLGGFKNIFKKERDSL